MPFTQLMAYISLNPQIDPVALSTYLVNEDVAYYPQYTVQLSAINEELIPETAASLNNFADALITKIDAYKGAVAGARSAAQQKFILGTFGLLLLHRPLQVYPSRKRARRKTFSCCDKPTNRHGLPITPPLKTDNNLHAKYTRQTLKTRAIMFNAT